MRLLFWCFLSGFLVVNALAYQPANISNETLAIVCKDVKEGETWKAADISSLGTGVIVNKYDADNKFVVLTAKHVVYMKDPLGSIECKARSKDRDPADNVFKSITDIYMHDTEDAAIGYVSDEIFRNDRSSLVKPLKYCESSNRNELIKSTVFASGFIPIVEKNYLGSISQRSATRSGIIDQIVDRGIKVDVELAKGMSGGAITLGYRRGLVSIITGKSFVNNQPVSFDSLSVEEIAESLDSFKNNEGKSFDSGQKKKLLMIEKTKYCRESDYLTEPVGWTVNNNPELNTIRLGVNRGEGHCWLKSVSGFTHVSDHISIDIDDEEFVLKRNSKSGDIPFKLMATAWCRIR